MVLQYLKLYLFILIKHKHRMLIVLWVIYCIHSFWVTRGYMCGCRWPNNLLFHMMLVASCSLLECIVCVDCIVSSSTFLFIMNWYSTSIKTISEITRLLLGFAAFDIHHIITYTFKLIVTLLYLFKCTWGGTCKFIILVHCTISVLSISLCLAIDTLYRISLLNYEHHHYRCVWLTWYL
jgi:hypothetical protein